MMCHKSFFSFALICCFSLLANRTGWSGETEALAVLEKHCGRCHNGHSATRDTDGYKGDFLYLLDVDELILNKKVVPGSADESDLFTALEDYPMPPVGKAPVGEVTAADKQTLRDWIAGMLIEATRKPLSLTDEFQAMLNYLKKLPPEQRARTRFFSLRTSHNNSQVFANELELQRLALAKTINSLSWRREFVQLTVLGNSTLYAFDLTAVNWNATTWEQIIAANPYALRYDSSPADETLNDLATMVYHETRTYVPNVRSDWFVTAATRPPLYHDLLDVPRHDRQLEHRLGIDAEDNIRQALVVRAGTDISGVSNQNRLVERHGNGHFGYYWKSYDFLPEEASPRSKLLSFPLGPRFRYNEYDQFAFEHDGGELIFRLPNGLQGYMLVDASGERIDDGPLEVVEDKTGRWSGSSKIVNGVSCMGCHSNGMIDVKYGDRVREGAGLFGPAARYLRRIYPGNDPVQEWIDKDRQEFRTACVRCFRTICGEDTELETEFGIVEPIGRVARKFVAAELNLQDLASDLGLADDERLAAAIEFNEDLRGLGLLPVAKGKKVPRSMWQYRGALTSRFQRAAVILDVGTAHVGLLP